MQSQIFNDAGSDTDEAHVLVAYYEIDAGDDFPGGNPRAELWSDGKWRVTHAGQTVMPELAEHLNVAFPPSKFDSPRWDCLIKAADEAARIADAELVLGEEYRHSPANPGPGVVY